MTAMKMPFHLAHFFADTAKFELEIPLEFLVKSTNVMLLRIKRYLSVLENWNYKFV